MNSDTEKTPQERLLNALDELTKPTALAERRDTNGTKQIFHRTDPPLLDWLRDSIGSSMGGNSGGGKSARERTPIDMGAFTLYEDLDGRIRSWMTELGGTPGKNLTPAQVLRSWYVLWSATIPTERTISSHANTLEGWVQQVKDVLDPPKRIEITSPCPVCGQEWINVGLKLPNGEDDPNDVERVHVLVAVERESIHQSFAMCRACDKVWTGTGEMRMLRILIDDAEAAKKAG